MLYVIVGIIIILIDQISKKMVDRELNQNEKIHIYKKLYFVKVYNYGAAYGVLKNKRKFLIIMTIISIIVLLFLGFCFEQNEFSIRLGLAIIIAGALGNLIDRIKYGYVIDFLYIKSKFKKVPIFNIADVAIFVGFLIILFYDISTIVFD